MKRSIPSAIVFLALVLAPALAAAQKVTYDFDKAKNFRQVKSFALDEPTKSDNPLVDQRVARAIAGALSARGISRVEHDPDVLVVPTRTTETRKEVTAYSDYWPSYGWGGWYWHTAWGPGYWGGGWGTTSYAVRNLRYDTLVIDMVDAKTGALIWRGTGVRRVHSNWKPDKVDSEMQETVAKIMSNFPPESSE
jgi:hypothetical protein